jgi:hypothetical protein
MEQRIKKILENAELYEKAAFILNERNLFLPSQVNAALSLELYFKALYLIDKNEDFKIKRKHSHNFHELFNLLSSEIKEKLNMKFNYLLSQRNMDDVNQLEFDMKRDKIEIIIPRTLEENLKCWSEIFINVRYSYDNKELRIMLFLPEIQQVVKETINDLIKK